MSARLRSFLARHPLLRDALLWAIPAIVVGAFLRGLLLYYMPYAYWGSDSRSYFSFAHKLLSEGYVSLDEKRRYVYPILMVPVSLLPGATLSWVAWLQHGFGLLTLLPLAYTVRKTLVVWRLWIVPVTLIYATMPMVLWYEHELLAENIFFATIIWTVAGWCAWVSEPQAARAKRLFWCFFVPFAVFLMTKPSGRFFWPGVCLGMLVVFAWRTLDWRRWAALGALVVATLTVGSKKQAAWLLYVAVFPLTQLQTGLHADYKAQIAEKVAESRAGADTYYAQDKWPFEFLETPGEHPDKPLWSALDRDSKKKAAVYFDLAKEAIRAEPVWFVKLGLQRVFASANMSEFKETRFKPEYYGDKFRRSYEEAEGKKPTPLRMLFALPKSKPLEPYPEFQRRLSPAPDSWAARAMLAWVHAYESVSDVVVLRLDGPADARPILPPRLTPLGWWLIAGMVLSLLGPYRRTLGVWTLTACGYLVAVFLVSQLNPRYFGPAWPIFVPLLAVPADVLVCLVTARLKPRPR